MVHWLRNLGARVAQWVRSLDLTTHTSLSPMRRGFAPGFANYKKWCTRLAAASDKVYQLLAHGRCFSPGTPVSCTTKTGRHDIAEILLKVALKHQKSKSNQILEIYKNDLPKNKLYQKRSNASILKNMNALLTLRKVLKPVPILKNNMNALLTLQTSFKRTNLNNHWMNCWLFQQHHKS